MTIYRAEHPDAGITLGHYANETAARAHCVAEERHAWAERECPAFDWIKDEDGKTTKVHVDKSTKLDKVVEGDKVKAYITDKGHTTTLQRLD